MTGIENSEMAIYSKTGDSGETSTLDRQRLPKNDDLIHFAGTVDELNSHLGLVKAMSQDEGVRGFIERMQKNLMVIMSHASDTGNEEYFFCLDEVTALEKEIDRLTVNTPEQFRLIIPGKNVTEAQIHIARAAARRAERLFFAANCKYSLCPKAGVYLNRLSDYLFVLSQGV